MRKTLAAIAVAGLVSAGCASPAPSNEPVDPALLAAASQEYQVGPGDKVQVTVFGQENLSGEFIVNGQGKIAYPLVGDVPVAGLTLSEISEAVAERLREGLVRDPAVATEIAEYRPFYILGEVNEPGDYPFAPELTVMGAVATAGGFTVRANTRHVYIRHAGETEENRYAVTNSTPILPGDVVRIAERMF